VLGMVRTMFLPVCPGRRRQVSVVRRSTPSRWRLRWQVSRSTSAPPSWPSCTPRTVVASAMVGVSWHPGCPVLLSIWCGRHDYWGFDDRPTWAASIVNGDIGARVVRVFRKMYNARFPIRRMVSGRRLRRQRRPLDGGRQHSAFNCRAVTGGAGWSIHSRAGHRHRHGGEPYVKGTLVLPATGAP